MPYEFLDNIVIADLAFAAWGPTLEETFVAAADAVMSAMVDDLDSIRLQEERPLRIEHEQQDLLLLNFLQELIYYKDADRLLLRVPQVGITQLDGTYALQATAQGEPLDPARHRLEVDVKAVTLHRFSLERTDQGWNAFVVLDV